MPELNRFAEQSKGKNVELVGIDAGETIDQVAAFVREAGVHFPVAIDEGDVGTLYGVMSYPVTVVIGADGRIALYETGMIANADVAFGREVKAGLETIARGGGVDRAAFIAAGKRETYFDVRPSEKTESGDKVLLTGRAKDIAETMKCVCGCSDTLKKCKCATAKGMKTKLKEATLDGTNDVRVMEAVNAEFCMKGMK
jgi:hypothetical protein